MDDTTIRIILIIAFYSWFHGYVCGEIRLVDRAWASFWKACYEIRYPADCSKVFTGWEYVNASKKFDCPMENLMWNGEELVPDYTKCANQYQYTNYPYC